MATKTITVNEETNVCWFLRKKQVNITHSVDPVGSGTVTPLNGKVNVGTVIPFKVIPNDGYEVVKVEVNGNEEPTDPEG